jgi:hypothetical protein
VALPARPIGDVEAGAADASVAGDSGDDDALVVVTPAENDVAMRNPGKGWLAYDFDPVAAPGGAKLSEYIDEVYTNYFSWGDLEPYEGQYAFFRIDALMNKYPGRKLRIGITLLDPTSRPWFGAAGRGQVPVWLSEKLCPSAASCRGRWSNTFEGFSLLANVQATKADAQSKLFEPAYWDSEFQTHHQRFIAALAKRFYSNDASVAGYAGAPDWRQRLVSIDMATYGVWGEWHSDIVWPGANASDRRALRKATLTTMVRHYYESFATEAQGRELPELEQSAVGSTISNGGPDNDIYDLSFGFDDPSAVRHSVEARGSAMVRKFLLADPALYFRADESKLVDTNVRKSPFRLEWGSCTGDLGPSATACLQGQPDTLPAALDRAVALRASLVGWYTDPAALVVMSGGESLEQRLQRRVGYQFVVSRASYPKTANSGSFTLTTTWFNRGSARSYRNYRLRAYLDKAGISTALAPSAPVDMSKWFGVSGPFEVLSAIQVPANVGPGRYELSFAVVDETGEPAMNLAIQGKDRSSVNEYGRYKLGALDVTR